jgi:two-component system chemotaxis sensor kinase CheA
LQAVTEALAALRSGSAGWKIGLGLRVVALQPLLQEMAGHAERVATELGKSVRVEVDAGGVRAGAQRGGSPREPLLHWFATLSTTASSRRRRGGNKPVQGRIRLFAGRRATRIVLSVEDDGGGLDVEARARGGCGWFVDAERARVLPREEVLDLIFLDGFSQREEVSELSRRGIGLGAARAKVERLVGPCA